eukprot:1363949-Amorphochlora_amoeboformis.AAC.1
MGDIPHSYGYMCMPTDFRKPSSSQHEQDMKIKELQKNSKLDPKKADMWGCGNADILKLILALLSIDPKQRPSAA